MLECEASLVTDEVSCSEARDRQQALRRQPSSSGRADRALLSRTRTVIGADERDDLQLEYSEHEPEMPEPLNKSAQ